ncbi:MAG: 6-pyruvoyl tetrahydropterin synthase family protein [Thermoplasmata archaeon]|nr:MAG: 6-pyruvoyl tetrahydropterin synthase family protein [Thermoplasmata archaeon]
MQIIIDGWDAGIKFSACHFIPAHDKCSRLHGHIYAINAKVEGSPGERGMLWDFITLKNALRSIAEELDHRVLIPGDSREMEIELGDELKVSFEGKKYVFPLDDVVVMDIGLASAEELAGFILERLLQQLSVPENVKALEIGVDEGRGQGAWVRREF